MKMTVYQSTGQPLGQEHSYVLKHFGSMLAAARRLESKFAALERRAPGDGNSFFILDDLNRVIGQKSNLQLLQEFSQRMGKACIYETEIDIASPLRLFDCWEDDPVGSGGLRIFNNTPGLTLTQRYQLKSLFHPFTDVIYPDHVFAAYSPSQLDAITAHSALIPFFNTLLEERRSRLKALGKFHPSSMQYEAVWVLLTLQVRMWSIENGFDSWVYANNSEGAGEDSYVLLHHTQLAQVNAVYHFNPEKYLECVKPIFNDFVAKTVSEFEAQHPAGPIPIPHMLWAGLDPLLFFEKIQ